MTTDDELAILRRRIDEALQEIDRIDGEPDSASKVYVLKTLTVSTYPTTAGRFYGVQISDPSGTESENSTPSYTDITGTAYALNLGAAIPAVGTRVIGRQVNGYFTFRY